MLYDPDRHYRRSVRLQDYDYTQNGAYYVTVCTHDRECLFGEIVEGQMQVTGFGEIIQEEWERTALVRANVILDAFVVMPNHVHGIIVIDNNCRGEPVARPAFDHRRSAYEMCEAQEIAQGGNHGVMQGNTQGRTQGEPPARPYGMPTGVIAGSLGAIMAQYKSVVSKRINFQRQTPAMPVWQRNYYERIIRNEEMLEKARCYIANNPARWVDDVNNPAHGK